MGIAILNFAIHDLVDVVLLRSAIFKNLFKCFAIFNLANYPLKEIFVEFIFFFSGGEPLFLLQCRWKFAKLYVVKISITAHYVCKYKVKPGIRELINTKCLVINYISLWLL